MTRHVYCLALALILIISGCGEKNEVSEVVQVTQPTLITTATVPPLTTKTPTSTITPSPTAVYIPTSTPTPTISPTPTITPSPTTSLWQTFLTPEPDNDSNIKLELVNQVGGTIHAVEVVDSYAYLGVGPRLIVLDVANPVSPYVVGQSDVLPGMVRSIKVTNGMAFVLLDANVLWLINVIQPANPQIINSMLTDRLIIEIAATENILYVNHRLDNQQFITLFDVADLENISAITSFAISGRWVLKNNTLYFLQPDETNLLAIWDMSDPIDPQIRYVPNIIAAGGELFDVSGDYLYLYGQSPEARLQIVDISDTANPLLVIRDDKFRLGLKILLAQNSSLFLVGDFCDAGSCGASVGVFNVSNSQQIKELDYVSIGHLAFQAIVTNELLYVATGESLVIIEPNSRNVSGTWRSTGNTKQIFVNDQTLFALEAFTQELWAFSLVDPTRPTLVGNYQSANYVQDIFFAGDIGYLATGADQAAGIIDILDVKNAAKFDRLGIFQHGTYVGNIKNIVVADEYAYVLLDGDLAVLDVGDPTTPQLLTTFNLTDYRDFVSFLWHDNLVFGATGAYVNEEYEGVHVIDLHDPENPQEVAYIKDVSRILAVTGDFAYAESKDGLKVLDISSLTDIRVVSTLSQDASLWSATVQEELLIIVSDALEIYDISLPSNRIS